MIVVSHDRYFLNRVADLLIVLEPGKVEVVYGNYDTYELLRATREAEEAAERKQGDAVTVARTSRRPQPRVRRRPSGSGSSRTARSRTSRRK